MTTSATAAPCHRRLDSPSVVSTLKRTNPIPAAATSSTTALYTMFSSPAMCEYLAREIQNCLYCRDSVLEPPRVGVDMSQSYSGFEGRIVGEAY